MKITDWVIIAIILFTPTSLYMHYRQSNQLLADNISYRLTEVMDSSTEDATYALLKSANSKAVDNVFDGFNKSSKDVELNLDYALETFYHTLFYNMGVDGNLGYQDELKAHIPLKLAIGYFGFYINTVDMKYGEAWLPMKPYSFYDSEYNLVINFSLDDYIKVFRVSEGKWYEGKREQIYSLFPAKVLSSLYFELTRKQTIIDEIKNTLQYYTYENNKIARQLNKGYYFSVPYASEATWNNTINDISFIAFMQAYPINGITKSFNCIGFGGTKLSLAKQFYGNTVGLDKMYHVKGCKNLLSYEEEFINRKEAAKKGYIPCPLCDP